MKKNKVIRSKKDKKIVSSKLQCDNCKYVFADFHNKCPECGSTEVSGYSEINPYSRMPLESVLKVSGHIMWLGGTFLFLFFLWATDSPDSETNFLMIRYAVLSLVVGVLCSVLYIGLSEVIHRVLRVQRRLKAFHENHHPNKTENKLQMKKSKKRSTLIQATQCRVVKKSSK